MPMPFAKITGQGLAAIACSVGILWGCVISTACRAARGVQRTRQGNPRSAATSTAPPAAHGARIGPLSFAPRRLHVTAG